MVLIVAKCNVNQKINGIANKGDAVLIVAKCNVNFSEDGIEREVNLY